MKHPIDTVTWIDPELLTANHYNPNHVFGLEMGALAQSIIEDGWTSAISITEENEIVDGFHRWTLARVHPGVRAVSNGLVPVVRLVGKTVADRMIATVRQNRARGQHAILKMASIVRKLVEAGLEHDEIMLRLGMEKEEVVRLLDARGSPDSGGRDSFGEGWVPLPAAEDTAVNKRIRTNRAKK